MFLPEQPARVRLRHRPHVLVVLVVRRHQRLARPEVRARRLQRPPAQPERPRPSPTPAKPSVPAARDRCPTRRGALRAYTHARGVHERLQQHQRLQTPRTRSPQRAARGPGRTPEQKTLRQNHPDLAAPAPFLRQTRRTLRSFPRRRQRVHRQRRLRVHHHRPALRLRQGAGAVKPRGDGDDVRSAHRERANADEKARPRAKQRVHGPPLSPPRSTVPPAHAAAVIASRAKNTTYPRDVRVAVDGVEDGIY